MVTRQELFDLVWAEPMVAVAKRFDVSGSYLARVCSRLNVPRPARGYWAKLAVGKASAKPPLPLARAGDEITWDPQGGLPEIARTSSEPSKRSARRNKAKDTKHPKGDLHELVAGAKPLFLAGRESYWGKYLKPSKRLLPEIHVSKTGLDSALALANELFLQLERLGHRVTLAAIGDHISRPSIDPRDQPNRSNFHTDFWSPARRTVLYIDGIAIGIAVCELTESTQMRYVNGTYVRESDYVPPKSRMMQQSHWTSTQDLPSGRFLILAYASYYPKEWSRTWKEQNVGDHLKSVSRIAREIAGHVADAARVIQEGKDAAAVEKARQAEMRKKWDEEERKRRIQKALIDSKAKIDQVLLKFSERTRLEEFLSFAESQMPYLDEENQHKLAALIGQARSLYIDNTCLTEFLEWVPPTRLITSNHT